MLPAPKVRTTFPISHEKRPRDARRAIQAHTQRYDVRNPNSLGDQLSVIPGIGFSLAA
jgi:hypothetical protein